MANNHGNMDKANRAKQFMPFDALKGFREALAEKERLIVPKRELSEEQEEEVDRKLSCIQKKDIITVVYFQKGEYVQITGAVSKKDEAARRLEIGSTKIPFEDIFDLQGR